MAITQQQINTGGGNGVASGNVTLPVGPAVGSLLVCTFGSGQVQDDPEIAGWTTAVQEGGRLSIYVKIADAADNLSPSWPWLQTTADQVGWVCTEYSSSSGWPSILSVIDVVASDPSETTAGPKTSGTTTASTQSESLVVASYYIRAVATTGRSYTNGFIEQGIADFGSGTSQIQNLFAHNIVNAIAAYETSVSWVGGSGSFVRGAIAVLKPSSGVPVDVTVFAQPASAIFDSPVGVRGRDTTAYVNSGSLMAGAPNAQATTQSQVDVSVFPKPATLILGASAAVAVTPSVGDKTLFATPDHAIFGTLQAAATQTPSPPGAPGGSVETDQQIALIDIENEPSQADTQDDSGKVVSEGS